MGKHLRSSFGRTAILWITIAMLLCAQGLRVCIHFANEAALGHAAASTHIEASFLADDASDHEDNGHASLSAILKDIQTKLSLFVILPVLLLLLPLASSQRVTFRAEPVSVTQLGWHLRPPLRAPPQ